MVQRIAATLIDTVWREGGQRRARQNAWAAMVQDRARARARADAASAFTVTAAPLSKTS